MLGAWVGVLARLWMRLIVVYPDPATWSGTLAVIISAAIGGLGLGLVRGARLTGRSKLWRLAALLALPFLGAPMGLGVFLLSGLLGGWALATAADLAGSGPRGALVRGTALHRLRGG